ncbi:14241_t:CDS:1, partial [Gigaspora margarita]
LRNSLISTTQENFNEPTINKSKKHAIAENNSTSKTPTVST